MPAELPGLVLLDAIEQGPVRKESAGRQVPLGRAVRVVQLSPGLPLDSPLAAPLRHEAKALSKLDHPGIVRLYEFRDDGTHLHLVLEDLCPESLEKVLTSPLSVEACLCLGFQIAVALGHAHGRGLVHGRLGARAVRFDRAGRVKVEGFATRSDETIEPIEDRQSDGLAPETTIGQNPSPISDLFALGTILYHALTGTECFGSSKDPGYPARLRNEHPEPLLKLRPETPVALKQLVERCLSKNPAERPSNTEEVASVLTAAGADRRGIPLTRELSERGIVQARADIEASLRQPASRRRTFRPPALLVGLLMGASLAAMAAWLFVRQPAPSDSNLSLTTVEKNEAMLLRVVATPWAHVVVDDQHLETTPFARPLELPPGRHVVRLEHPHAPPEERLISGAPGEAVLLDVRMMVKRPLPERAPETPRVEDSP